MPRQSRKPSARTLQAVRTTLRTWSSPEHQEAPPRAFLRHLCRRHRSVGAALAWLVALDAEEWIRDHASMALFVAARDPHLAPQSRQLILDAAVPQLLRALGDRAVSDDRKYLLLPVLAAAGVEVPPEELEEHFDDFEATATRVSRQGALRLTETPEALEAMLQVAGLVRHDGGIEVSEADLEVALHRFANAAEANPPVGAALLCTAVLVARHQGLQPSTCVQALEYLGSRRHGRVAWYVEELSCLPAMGELGEHALRVAEGLQEAGVLPVSPAPRVFAHGHVSGVDGAGSRSMALYYRTDSGEMDALSILLNDQTGIKDMWCIYREGALLEQQYRDELPGPPPVPVDLHFARRLLADALYTHVLQERPIHPHWLLYRPYLNLDPLIPEAHEPNLGAYQLETYLLDPGLVGDSAQLLEHPLYGELWCASPEAYAYLSRERRRDRGGRDFPLSEESFRRYLRSVAVRDRDLVARRLAANLETEARAGRARNHLNRLAARTWLALTQGVLPFDQVPYIEAVNRLGVRTIAHNLTLGFQDQAAASAACWGEEYPGTRPEE